MAASRSPDPRFGRGRADGTAFWSAQELASSPLPGARGPEAAGSSEALVAAMRGSVSPKYRGAFPRVLLAASPPQCAVLRGLLDGEASIDVVTEENQALAVLNAARTARPDVIVLDLADFAQTSDGLFLCRRMTAYGSGPAILALSDDPDEALPVAAARAGARGYLLKDFNRRALVWAVRTLAQGGHAFDPRLLAGVVDALHSSDPEALTDRERAVLVLVARGLSNSAIGRELYITRNTVKYHLSNLMRKLGTHRRTGAVYEAVRRGLI